MSGNKVSKSRHEARPPCSFFLQSKEGIKGQPRRHHVELEVLSPINCDIQNPLYCDIQYSITSIELNSIEAVSGIRYPVLV